MYARMKKIVAYSNMRAAQARREERIFPADCAGSA